MTGDWNLGASLRRRMCPSVTCVALDAVQRSIQRNDVPPMADGSEIWGLTIVKNVWIRDVWTC